MHFLKQWTNTIKLGKIIFLMVFFSLNDCGLNEPTTEIESHVYLSNTLGNDKAELDLSYFSHPVGGFIIDEIWIGGVKIDGPPKEAKASVGCGGVVFSAQGIYFKKQKIQFDKRNRDLVLITKWTGERSNELIQKYKLPPIFEVVSISNKISKSEPLHLELKDAIVKKDWDSCSLKLKDKPREDGTGGQYHSNIDIFLSAGDATELIRKIDISFKRLQKTSENTLPSNLNVRLICYKEFKSQEKIANQGIKKLINYSSFGYLLRTNQYLVSVSPGG